MSEVLPLAGIDRLAEHLPQTWIDEALAATGSASIRRRRLPAEQVVWLVIALARYRHQSMPEVLATLDLAQPAASRSRARNLGRTDRLQPGAPGDGQSGNRGKGRADRSELRARAAYSATRDDLGRRHGPGKAACPPDTTAHPDAVCGRRKTTGASKPPVSSKHARLVTPSGF
ncbi:MAG: transposase domain-containing protein [Proteobacteria bacterium]|nr:transposase domain-containing protein [Pseudomonadota bacterium]